MSEHDNRPAGAGDSAADAVGTPRQTSLLRSSAVMASGTLVSRILGFIRAALLVAAIGGAAGQVSAAFQVANTLPNTVYNLLAAGVFDAVLVPQIVRALKQRSGDVYVNRLLTVAGTILFGVTLVAMVASPLLVTILAGTFSGELRALTIGFSLVCLPQIFFYGLYNLLGELLNARGVFGPYMWAPVVNNIVAIAGLIVFMSTFGGAGSTGTSSVADFTSAQFWVLAGTATLGVICQAMVLVIPMRRAGVRVNPDFRFRGTSFGTASTVAGWTFATLGISQLGVISTTQLATRADAWADLTQTSTMAGYTAYTTMFMIYMVPQSLISVSLATAIFTRLANAAADRDHRTVANQYTTGITLITMLSLLSAAILIAGATPMVQMILPGTTNPDVISAYTLILVALMPGVASTGMVLMSQRVFFAYEDARPVFLMGIVPTLLQIIVGWSIYFAADPQWWTFGASLGETVCRLVQGFLAVIWVARKIAFVNPGRIIASYLRYLVAGVAAWALAALVLHLIGPMTLVDNGGLRFIVATLKLVLVTILGVAVYFGVLHLIDPVSSSRAMDYVAARVPGASRVRAALLRLPGRRGAPTPPPAPPAPAASAAPALALPPPPTSAERRAAAVAAADAERTGWSMIARQWSASDPTHTGEFPIVGRRSARAGVPTFEEVLGPAVAAATSSAAPDAVPSSSRDQGGPVPSGEESTMDPHSSNTPASGGEPPDDHPGDLPAERPGEQPRERPGDQSGEPSAQHAADQVGTPPTVPDAASAAAASWAGMDAWLVRRHSAFRIPAGDAAQQPAPPPNEPPRPEEPADSAGTPHQANQQDEPNQHGQHGRSDLPAAPDHPDHPDRPGQTRPDEPIEQGTPAEHVGAPADATSTSPLSPRRIEQAAEQSWEEHAPTRAVWDVPVPDWPRTEAAPPWEPPSSPKPAPTRSGGGRGRRVNPTVPALLFAAALVVGGGWWAIHQVLQPVSGVEDLTNALNSSLSGEQSGAEAGPSPTSTTESPTPEPTVAPNVVAARVFSWADDGGDHEDLAINLIDGDASTQWYSRYYEMNQFTDDSTVTILLSLEQQSTLSQISIAMEPGTSGGEVVVRAVDNPDTPRVGTELATSALSESTVITLDPPAELTYVSLSFRSLPVDYEGVNRAWINEITLK